MGLFSLDPGESLSCLGPGMALYIKDPSSYYNLRLVYVRIRLFFFTFDQAITQMIHKHKNYIVNKLNDKELQFFSVRTD